MDNKNILKLFVFPLVLFGVAGLLYIKVDAMFPAPFTLERPLVNLAIATPATPSKPVMHRGFVNKNAKHSGF